MTVIKYFLLYLISSVGVGVLAQEPPYPFCESHVDVQVKSDPLEGISMNEILHSDDCIALGYKLYINPGRVLVSNKGISLDLFDQTIQVDHLLSDELGVYIPFRKADAITGKCLWGHPIWHSACGGCGVLWCPFRCQCFGEGFPFTP